MRIRIIDAFTDRPFAGNPAAVCLLEDADTWPDETWMQQVAAEMHLSETAFAHPLADRFHRYSAAVTTSNRPNATRSRTVRALDATASDSATSTVSARGSTAVIAPILTRAARRWI